MGPVVSLHDQLVGSGHQGQTVGVVERLGDILHNWGATVHKHDLVSQAVFKKRYRPSKSGTIFLLPYNQSGGLGSGISGFSKSRLEIETRSRFEWI